MNCKVCDKELIGKEKYFCRSCWAKGIEKVKIGAIHLASIAALGLMAKKGNIKDAFNDKLKDSQ